MTKRSRRELVKAFAWEQFAYWVPAAVILGWGADALVSGATVAAPIDGILAVAWVFLGARSWIRHRPTRTARLELLAALPRIVDGDLWLARDDHQAFTGKRKWYGAWYLHAIPEDQVHEIEDGPSAIVFTSYVAMRMDNRVTRVIGGTMIRPDGDSFAVDREHRSWWQRARETGKLLRIQRTGMMTADAAEIAELARQIRVAEPMGLPEDLR